MPLTGSGSLLKGSGYFGQHYEKVLVEIQKAAQKVSHLWSQVMGYIPDGSLDLFSINKHHFSLERNKEGKVEFCYYSMADGERGKSLPKDILSVSQTLDSYRLLSSPSPADLHQSFFEAIALPLKQYEAVEPERASKLRKKLKSIESR